jgi:hypothetical protein
MDNMNTTIRRMNILMAILVAGCDRKPEPTPPPSELPPAPVVVVVASCDDPVGGIPLSDGLVEAERSYDERVAAIDITQLPPRIDISAVDGIMRAVLAYTLELPPDELRDELDRDEVAARGRIGAAVLAAFASNDADPLDFALLRQGLHRFYACDRGLPVNLNGFRATFGDFAAWPSVVVENSRPKAGPRRLYSDDASQVFVAESLDGDVVRETEIVFGGTRVDGMLEFVVYDEDGVLSAASRFATNGGSTVQSASPYTCLFCHVDRDSLRFDVVHP